MQLTLGPILYYWPRQQVLDFYAAAADWPVATIYLGEVVCARRHELKTADWLALGQELAQQGKQVVFSSQAVLESGSDLSSLRRLAAAGGWLEANDLGAIRVARQSEIPYVAGTHLNIYNGSTLDWHAQAGAVRWLPPLEASQSMVAQILAERTNTLETELFAHGHLPLAFSARCFTARHYDLNKDACEFKCLEHPIGLALHTREGQAFLRLNGIQTQSAACHALIADIPQLQGIDYLRISPQPGYTAEIIAAYSAQINTQPHTIDWQQIHPEGIVNGYWHGQAGIRPTAQLETI
ncbi:U32 family peptidase [Chitinibacter tainanensis]|uniref:U32 family peptidase n=1 Tax=Chitinibacter tainanensis TaxID=230667 RepID=UPI0004281735|nr:U32 family peptidase [Chitinibacter tainanensis]